MLRHVDVELRGLKEKILAMGGCVESAIEEAVQALLSREPERFARVHELEDQINQAHIAVDELCVQVLARQQPMAADLRLVVSIIKINTDLERMGDQAVNISHNSSRYLEEAPLQPQADLPQMTSQVKVMVRRALDAFVKQDRFLAQQVLDMDDSVDALKNKLFRDLVALMEADPKTIQRALNLILIARNLERLGDHATNIAEDVIFAVTGDDIRHPGLKLRSKFQKEASTK